MNVPQPIRSVSTAQRISPPASAARSYKHVGCGGRQVNGASIKTLAVRRARRPTETGKLPPRFPTSRLRSFRRETAACTWPPRNALFSGNVPDRSLTVGRVSRAQRHGPGSRSSRCRRPSAAVGDRHRRDANQPADGSCNDARASSPYSRLTCCNRISALTFQSPCGSCLTAR